MNYFNDGERFSLQRWSEFCAVLKTQAVIYFLYTGVRDKYFAFW